MSEQGNLSAPQGFGYLFSCLGSTIIGILACVWFFFGPTWTSLIVVGLVIVYIWIEVANERKNQQLATQAEKRSESHRQLRAKIEELRLNLAQQKPIKPLPSQDSLEFFHLIRRISSTKAGVEHLAFELVPILFPEYFDPEMEKLTNEFNRLARQAIITMVWNEICREADE